MKPRYYCGALSLNKGVSGIQTYGSLEEAVAAVSPAVTKLGEVRYIVKTVAMVEPAQAPVKVTLMEEEWTP